MNNLTQHPNAIPTADHAKNATRLDITWNNAPTILIFTEEEKYAYQLTPKETYALARKLIGYLSVLHDTGETE